MENLKAGNEVKDTIFVTYERKSTLWKNANAFYKMQDWTKMECGFMDWSDMRKYHKENRIRYTDKKTGKDITEQVINERFSDVYYIRLINERGTNTKIFTAKTRDEANKLFLEIKNDKHINGWHKVTAV